MLVLVLNSGSSSIACWLLEVLEKRGMGSSPDMVTIGRRPATGSGVSRPRNECRRSLLVPQGLADVGRRPRSSTGHRRSHCGGIAS
jgi:hypothetical protein